MGTSVYVFPFSLSFSDGNQHQSLNFDISVSFSTSISGQDISLATQSSKTTKTSLTSPTISLTPSTVQNKSHKKKTFQYSHRKMRIFSRPTKYYFYQWKCPLGQSLYYLNYVNFLNFKFFKNNNSYKSMDPNVSILCFKQFGLRNLVVKNANNRLLFQLHEPAAWAAFKNLLEKAGDYEYSVFKRRKCDLDLMNMVEKIIFLFFETLPKINNSMIWLNDGCKLNYFEDDCKLVPFHVNLRPKDLSLEEKVGSLLDVSSAIDPQVRRKMALAKINSSIKNCL